MNTTTAQKEINITLKKVFPHHVTQYGDKEPLTVTLAAYRLGGNSHPHFSATGSTKNLGGCIHEEILKAWPESKIIVDMHLSNADDGAPMYAVENGWYWIAGIFVDHCGERYHGGSDKTSAECAKILSEHLRISVKEVADLCYRLAKFADKRVRKTVFENYVDNQRPRWQKEADEALAWMEAQNK